MTAEEKVQFTAMEKDIQEIKNEFIGMSKKFDEMYYALVGNKLAQDGGLVQRVIDAENELKVMSKKIDIIEKKHDRNDLYIKIIWSLIGAIGTGVAAFLASILSKK